MQRAILSACGLRTLLGLALGLLVGCGSEPLERYEYEQALMGTSFRIVLYASAESEAAQAAQAAFSRVGELNALLSDWDPESELSRLGRASEAGAPTAWIPLSEELYAVLEAAEEVSRASDGAFDVTVGPYVRLWRRARRQFELPSTERLERARTSVGHGFLELDPERRAARLLAADMRLDLGGIAKGYALDEALRVLRERGLGRALVDGGGDLLLGEPPPGKAGWRVAVEGQSSRLVLSQCSLCTSGDVYQHVELDGVRYSHLVDPRTGGALTHQRQVSVIAASGMEADALASALSVMGQDEGFELAARRGALVAQCELSDLQPRWRIDAGFRERVEAGPVGRGVLIPGFEQAHLIAPGGASACCFGLDVDVAGRVYLAGAGRELSGAELATQGGNDAWVVCRDAEGASLWEVALGGSGEDYAHELVAVPLGGAWVVGSLGAPTLLGGRFELPAGGFAARLDAQGRVRAAIALPNGMRANCLDVDEDDGAWIGGEVPGERALVVHVDFAGELRELRECARGARARVQSLDVDALGRLFVAGVLGGSGSIDGEEPLRAGEHELYARAFDSDGAPLWTLRRGGAGADREEAARAILGDGQGGAWLAGSVSGAPDHDAPPQGATGERDALLMRVEASGEVRWTRVLAGIEQDTLVELVPDRVGVLALGVLSSGVEVGSAVPFAETGELALVEFRQDGSSSVRLRARCAALSAGDEFARELALTPDGDAWLAGWMRERAQFGALELEAADATWLARARLSMR